MILLNIGLVSSIMAYPMYVHIVGTQYAKRISTVFNSKDINKIDKFLEKSTIIAIITEKTICEISYEEAREYIKVAIEDEKFESRSSYGHIGGEDNKYESRQEVGIFWSLAEIGSVEISMYLKRKFIFWYTIERIEIYHDRDGYCQKMFMGENIER